MEYDEFNRQVIKKLATYAANKGWKLDKKSDEPSFIKGKGEVYFHTDDAVIFGTIGGKMEKKGKYFAKQYSQDMGLFSGNYTTAKVNKYIQHGRATISQIDKKLKSNNYIKKKVLARRKFILGGIKNDILRGVMD